MHEPFIIQITGPTGAGKSTISEMLAKQLTKCANIEADHVKHFTKFGFYKDNPESQDWHFSEWPLVGNAIGLLAKLYASKRNNVIVNGYIGESAWDEVDKHIQFTHRFLLLPNSDELLTRDNQRAEDNRMGAYESQKHLSYFTSTRYFDNYILIDSSKMSAEETLTKVRESLGI